MLESAKKNDIYFGDSVPFMRTEWWEILEVEAELDVGDPQIQIIRNFNPNLSEEKLLSLLVFGLTKMFCDRLYDLCFAANLARPGSIELFPGNALR